MTFASPFGIRQLLRRSAPDRKAVDEAAKLLSGGDGAGAARRLDALDASAPKPGGPPR